ncbi:hypothetical protein [Acinetobacter wuhouensis]|uniref:Uncharacterized protein n=1 Tax=Acinetobacter wuhouensis TaxID=1879050 RepID=A0A3G2T2E6_9GAMM|nr:hypothetical protein [Acinetobacter wuhouensis]AYO54165.1 hypothetical protein CDG68_11185 [Acinetobacter wuhouensis]
MNILNGNEAFTAMMAGKNIMCRAVGGLIEFDDLSQFPATVFAMPGYEFCIKIDFIELAGISFLKPFSIDELVADQEIYICENYSRITKCQFIPDRVEMRDAVISGFVQRDRENAANQIKAIQKALGIETEIYFQEIDYKELLAALATKNREPKKRETRKKTDVNLDVAKTVTPKGTESTDEPWGEAKNNTSEVVETHKPNSRPAFTVDEVAEIETDTDALLEKFTTQILNCTTTDAVLSIRPIFFANGHLEREHTQHLCKLTEEKLLELDPKQYAPKQIKNDHQIYIDALNVCSRVDEIETTLRGIESEGFSEDQLTEIEQAKQAKLAEFQEKVIAQANEEQYQKLLAELIEHAQKADSPKEANALYKYTVEWTEEQRKPLMSAITKRLNELNADAPPVEQPPSLMVRIQSSQNERELNELLPEIRSRHADIQPKLMDCVRARRFELENGVT